MATDAAAQLDTNASVKLTASELSDLLRILRKLLPNLQGSHLSEEVAPLEVALRIYGARRDRRHFLPEEIFSDPAWDMLIFLFCKEGQGEMATVTALCHASETPPTTALRWIAELERRGLIQKTPHPSDRRSNVATLSDAARKVLTAYFQRVGERNLNL